MLAYKYIGNYHYDNSNRLLYAQNINQGDNTYSVLNSYDKDGNLTTLKRYGDNNILADNFIYNYSPGTNKLTRVSGATDQFGHDLPANVGVPKSLLKCFEDYIAKIQTYWSPTTKASDKDAVKLI